MAFGGGEQTSMLSCALLYVNISGAIQQSTSPLWLRIKWSTYAKSSSVSKKYAPLVQGKKEKKKKKEKLLCVLANE